MNTADLPSPDFDRLTAYARQGLSDDARLISVSRPKLEGGYVGYGVSRYDLDFRLTDGRTRTASFVHKLTTQAEVQTMLALADVADAGAVPALVDFDPGYAHNDITWFVTPFYEGTQMQWGEAVPLTVLRSLAYVHAHFLSRAGDARWLHRVDASFFTRTFANAVAALQTAAERIPAVHEAASQLAAFPRMPGMRGIPVLLAALERLPVTLVHGDVHPGNIIRLAGGEGVLIDWGTARVAPALLDIANVVALGSDDWRVYLAAYEAASGQPIDLTLATLGCHWATAMVNLQYLPWVALYRPDNAAHMVTQVIQAAEDIQTTVKKTFFSGVSMV
jgi:aminoglycoside phosphotransferase (APT) family kinase protein